MDAKAYGIAHGPVGICIRIRLRHSGRRVQHERTASRHLRNIAALDAGSIPGNLTGFLYNQRRDNFGGTRRGGPLDAYRACELCRIAAHRRGDCPYR